MMTNPTSKGLYRSFFNLHGNPINTLPLSAWRTAFAAALFETDKSRMTLAVLQAQTALAERLESPGEMSTIERISIQAARSELSKISAGPLTLEGKSVPC